MSTPPYGPEVRALAIALLAEGNTLAAVQARTGVSRRTLINWRANAKASPVADENQRKEIGDLIIKNLQTGMAAMNNIQQLFADPEYIRKFAPGELGTAFGILSDKSLRILEAFCPEDDQTDG